MLKILSGSEFKSEWNCNRQIICELPTEFVYPNRYTGEKFDILPQRAYGYRLPDTDFPVEVEEKNNSKWYHRFYAIEVWGDWGNDGHVEYKFENMYFIVRDDEIPKNLLEYNELTNKFYDERQEEKHRQWVENQKKVKKDV